VTERVDFSPLELDALQETMNIGFGQAAATLSEVINMHVILNVPKIALLSLADIPGFIEREIENPEAFIIVEQFFLGRFNGTSFLLLPENEGAKLVDIFSDDPCLERSTPSLDTLQRETVIEIGNIIIGACVGKIAEMLGDVVTYKPPRYFSGRVGTGLIEKQLISSRGMALVFKTIFHFDKQDVAGLLFLVTGESSVGWLKTAVDKLLGGMCELP
jgi:chemotaxis protein CheC